MSRVAVLALACGMSLTSAATLADELKSLERSTAAADIALAHGVLAFEEGDYERAVALFEEAAARDTSDTTALHWLGLTYLKLGRAADALAPLQAGCDARKETRVCADLELARDLANGEQSAPVELAAPEETLLLRDPLAPRRWSAQVGIALGEDSNPGLLPEETAELPLLAGPRESVSDSAAELDMRLELLPLHDRRGWSLGASVEGSQSRHDRFTDLDMRLLQGHLSLAWGGDPRGYLIGPLDGVPVPSRPGRIALVLQAGGYDLQFGGDNYLRVVEGGGSFLVRESAKTSTQLDVEIRDRTFELEAAAPRLRSGSEISLEVGQSFALGRLDRRLRLGLLAGERGGSKAFESSFEGMLAELSFSLLEDWMLLLTGNWREERFSHLESRLGELGPKREDSTWTVSATAVWRWSEHMQWTASGSYWRNDSSLERDIGGRLFDYHRTVVSAGLIWSLR